MEHFVLHVYFVKALILFLGFLDFNNMKVFAITFDQFNASLINTTILLKNKSIYKKKKNLQTINFCKVVCI